MDLYLCHICNRGDGEEDMLLCDGCDGAFHTYCLVPLVTEIPKGDWRCPECVALVSLLWLSHVLVYCNLSTFHPFSWMKNSITMSNRLQK